MTGDDLNPREKALREDLLREYFAVVSQISEHDGRMISVKGWSVTLSLTALGLGFQTGHYALFMLAALTGAGFWFLNGLLKGHQVRHYARVREIEVVAHALNAVDIEGTGPMSSPRIGWSWTQADRPPAAPVLLTSDGIRRSLKLRFFYPNVMFPHLVAVALGAGLFIGAALGMPWLSTLEP